MIFLPDVDAHLIMLFYFRSLVVGVHLFLLICSYQQRKYAGYDHSYSQIMD